MKYNIPLKGLRTRFILRRDKTAKEKIYKWFHLLAEVRVERSTGNKGIHSPGPENGAPLYSKMKAFLDDLVHP